MDLDLYRRMIKNAQQEAPVEVAEPEEGESKETVVTCLSNCTYAQNPEKRCMLEMVSFSMDPKSGAFECGQYQPAQELMSVEQGMSGAPGEPQGPQGAQAEQSPQQQRAQQPKKQPGLPGTPVQ